MSKPIANKVYDLYGRFYDRFEVLFRKRLATAIGAMPLRDGDRVLDVGIGTGLSLEFYPGNVSVTGVDISAGMLRQAERKLSNREVRAGCPRERTQLMQADALELPFADGTFDGVVLSHVVATVADPGRCLGEAIRVAREGATIVVVNYFRSAWPVVNWVETAIDPICRRLGWRSELGVEELLDAAGIERDGRRIGTGVVFRIVYLHKVHGAVRVTTMRDSERRAAKLGGVQA